MKRVALVLLIAFSGACATLLAMPNVDLPCTVSVNYKVARFFPTSKKKLAGEIRTVDQTRDFIGVGRMRGSQMVCEVNVANRT